MTDDTNDLKARLRRGFKPGGMVTFDDIRAAAERIADLEHALAEKQQLVTTYVEASMHNLDRALAAERERDEARAECERLQSVLAELLEAVGLDSGLPGSDDADEEPVGWSDKGDMHLTFGHIRRARAALTPKPDPVAQARREAGDA